MLKTMKTVLASTLTIAAVCLGVAAYNGVAVTDIPVPENAQSFLKPILYNANSAKEGMGDVIVETSAARVRRQVRRAAVEIITPLGRGSGTLFEIDGHYVVFTAAHVIGDMPVVAVTGRNGEQVFGTTILTANDVDMAVVLVPEMNSRKAMPYRPASHRDINNVVGEEVTYTGFPAHHDLLTIDGVIAAEEGGNLVMHSYAWPGSSGSGVFNMKGRFLGVVRAVDVGVWSYQLPPQLVEDMVWISPAWDITKQEIKRHLKMRGQQ
jgi:S1-C subfamily serine protease